ncbi:MAG: HEAT repeat domain-containing protein [Lentisphaerae bacterium]|nr:HEAT repeat domain-containing protein [Lentisphaerota bacterium]
MNTKRIVVAGVTLAVAVAALLVFFSRREGPVRTERDAREAPRPVFPVSTGVVVRPLPPSAMGARTTAGRRPPAVSASKDVAAVMDASDKSLEARLSALAGLGKALQEQDVDALISFMDRRNAEDALPPEKLNALKNDVANLLRAQLKFPDVLPWRLANMWRDTAHDEVWRDYCIQHAGAAWPRISASAARDEVRSLLWTAAADPAAPGAGTALISLRNLVSSGSEEKAKVAERASALAATAETPEGVRVTALQIAAELGAPGTAALARSLLPDRSQPVHLRMSAAAALGRAGDASDLPALEALASTSDPRLRAAASSAVRRLSEKPNAP